MPYDIGSIVNYSDSQDNSVKRAKVISVEKNGAKHKIEYTTIEGSVKIEVVDTSQLNLPKDIHFQAPVIHEGQKQGRRGSVQIYARPVTINGRKQSLEQKVKETPAQRQRRKNKRNKYNSRGRHYEGKTHGHVARANSREIETHQVTKAAITIHSWARRHLVRKHLREKHNASIIIQKYTRRYAAEYQQALRAARDGRIRYLMFISKHIKLDHLKDRNNKTILHVICDVDHVTSKTFNQRFKSASWVKKKYPSLLEKKDKSGHTGSWALQVYAACVIQTIHRSVRSRMNVMFESARRGKLGALKVLLKYSNASDKLYPDSHGSTLLHLAATCKHRENASECIKYISKTYKRMVATKDKDGRLPSHIASFYCSGNNNKCDEVIKTFLTIDEDKSFLTKDKYNQEPIDYISKAGDLATILFLIEKSSQIYSKFVTEDKMKKMISSYASWSSYTDLVKNRSNRVNVDFNSDSSTNFTFDLNSSVTSSMMKHVENYEGMVSFPLFKRFLSFESDNVYFFTSPVEWNAPRHNKISNSHIKKPKFCPSKHFLYFEMCLHGFLGETFDLKVGFTNDAEWKPLTDSALINELAYEEDLEEVLKHWNTNTNNMDTHPVEKESNFFNVNISNLCKTHKVHSVSRTSNVVGCGWDPNDSKLFLCINGKLINEKELQMPSNCSLRPGFSFNKESFKNVLRAMGGDACKIEINFGRKPFVYVPAWKEKLERVQMLNINPHLKNQLGFSLERRPGISGNSWSCNNIVYQWCSAIHKSNSYGTLKQNRMKLFTVYPLIHDIVNSNLSRVQEIMGASENKYFDEMDLRSTNHLINISNGTDARSLANQQDGYCLSTWPVEPTNRSILHIASTVTSSTEILEFLLAIRPDDDVMSKVDIDGCTPLHIAARMGNTPALERLCKTLVAKISSAKDSQYALKKIMQLKSNGGMNMLHHAVISGNIDTIDYVLSKNEKIYRHLSNDHNQIYEVEENGKLSWSMLKSAPIHYAVFIGCGILPAGSCYLNISSYERMKRGNNEDRLETSIELFRKFSSISEKVLHQTDLKDRDAKKLAKDLKNAVGLSIGTIVCSEGMAIVTRDNNHAFKKFNRIGDQVIIAACHKSINGEYTISGSMSKSIELKTHFDERFEHTYHGGLLTSKDISATSVGPLIIPSLIGGDLSQIKNNCNRMTSVLSDILNNAIDSMWRKTFQKEKKEIAYGAEDNANRMEEEEIEMINQKILRAKKEKEARLEAARLREIEFLAERNRLAKERKKIEMEILEEKKLIKSIKKTTAAKQKVIAEKINNDDNANKQSKEKIISTKPTKEPPLKKKNKKKNKKIKKKGTGKLKIKKDSDVEMFLATATPKDKPMEVVLENKENASKMKGDNNTANAEEQDEAENDDFQFDVSGGDESAPPPPINNKDSINVKILPKNTKGNNNIQKSPQQKLMETSDFEVNNVDENNLTLLARTAKGSTPKNNKPTNNYDETEEKTLEDSLEQKSLEELRRMLKRALYNESIVRQANHLVKTLRETGLQNFGMTVDALDQASEAFVDSNALPTMYLDNKPIQAWSWSGVYEDIVRIDEDLFKDENDKIEEIEKENKVRNAKLERTLDKFELETQKATRAMNKYAEKQKKIHRNKDLFSHSFDNNKPAPKQPAKPISITLTNSDLTPKESRVVKSSLTKTKGMQNWANRIKSMRSNKSENPWVSEDDKKKKNKEK